MVGFDGAQGLSRSENWLSLTRVRADQTDHVVNRSEAEKSSVDDDPGAMIHQITPENCSSPDSISRYADSALISLQALANHPQLDSEINSYHASRPP